MNWDLLIQFLVAVAVMAVSVFLLPWIKEKIGAEKTAQLMDLVSIAVQAAEQMFGPGTGEQKKAYVVDWLTQQGVNASSDTVNAMIEAEVLNLND